MPSLVLLNGLPGVGKTTLAERYLLDHPLALKLDIDAIRCSMGHWQARDEPKHLARGLATEMAWVHLLSGHHVVVPQTGRGVLRHHQPWPDFDPAALHAAGHVGGPCERRTRVTVEVVAGLGETEATEVGSAAAIAGRLIVRTVFVPERLLNLVTG